ncbi:hypothetical protein [Allochromatium palmeri]|uniref:Uncharacterized protein n=1 Tax=Allochromatium palmeri TaxID=231048 RepID=A0A6N8EC41_9GAMM|nr:hypothetical protein [Allochromatium palmeri]MTW21782.1 hypothetical protein [Allochromatium palmeri]
MSRPGFGEGVLVALTAALLASIVQSALGGWLPSYTLAHGLCIGLGLGYGLYLLARAREPAGRIAVPILWAGVSLLVALLHGGLGLQILVQLGLVWLVRALYHHGRPLSALLDLGLLLLGGLAGLWALEHTGSLFLALWTLFLIQALFVLIPGGPDAERRASATADPFETAERAAERALARLLR